MKAVKYLFFSCFNTGGKLNKLKQEKLALQVEEERLCYMQLQGNPAGIFLGASVLFKMGREGNQHKREDKRIKTRYRSFGKSD